MVALDSAMTTTQHTLSPCRLSPPSGGPQRYHGKGSVMGKGSTMADCASLATVMRRATRAKPPAEPVEVRGTRHMSTEAIYSVADFHGALADHLDARRPWTTYAAAADELARLERCAVAADSVLACCNGGTYL